MNQSRDSLYARIYQLTSQVPAGRVTTYGDIAKMVRTTARVVGFALAALPEAHEVPWQRVINSKGEVSPRRSGDSDHIQQLLLETEGICFDEQQRVDLSHYRWVFHE